MTKSEIPCLIDAVELGEIHVNLVRNGMTAIVAEAKYALTVTSTETRVGAGNRNYWSDETQQKLRELIASMEADICIDVFGKAPTTDSSGATDSPNWSDVRGL